MNEGVLPSLLVFYYIQVVNIVFKQNIIRFDVIKCMYVNNIVFYNVIN